MSKALIPPTGYALRILIQSCRDMRDLQKGYFTSKSPSILYAAKKREKQVDAILSAFDWDGLFNFKGDLVEFLKKLENLDDTTEWSGENILS